MSKAKGQNNKRPNGNGAGPTRSFDGSGLGTGSQIGPFRIERELGRGAVGVVYLAHDTKLDRSVAIKSLPAEVMANPKARSRFSREARLLASLNHPNIATIYEELEEADGVGYLILEYVPGQTLAERIAKSGFKLQESLSIALQIAEAVAAAHEHDVIHRDLKPGNIKITPEGKVKVLDFGLAKAVGGEALDQQSTVTEPGRVIGTPAYMSPEQARGQPTDKRSDIWSFACVLYEMLTGRVPFRGETISDTLANILQAEPNWQVLPERTPMNIRVLLRRCLEKDPCRRLRDIGDAGIEISEALTQPLSTSAESGPSRHAPWKVAALYAFVGLVVGAIAMLVVMRRPIQSSEPKPVRRYSITPNPQDPLVVDFNGDGIVDSADMCIMVNHWHTDEQLYDIAPRPLGDGIVDIQDLIILAEHLFEEPGLIAHWKLDETEGSIAHDSISNNDGTLNGNPAWQPTGGMIGGALAFDGIDDYVDCGNASIFEITEQITLAAWIKVNAFDKGWQAIVTKGDCAWRIQRAGHFNRIEFACDVVSRAGQSHLRNVLGDVSVDDGRWHHVAGVFDGEMLYLYVDGVLDNSRDAPGEICNNQFNVYIGENSEIVGHYWNGLIDDVRIYDQALSAEEIAAMAQQATSERNNPEHSKG